MSTPYESAQLVLKLYELRRDALLREARNWFLRDFNPESVADITALSLDQNRMYRMVTGYWNMAASFVTYGAIDRQMFLDGNGEIFATFAKVQPFLGELRELNQLPDYLEHVEQAVLASPDAEKRLERLRRMFRSLWTQATAPRDPE
jgi:hypothetical protein